MGALLHYEIRQRFELGQKIEVAALLRIELVGRARAEQREAPDTMLGAEVGHGRQLRGHGRGYPC